MRNIILLIIIFFGLSSCEFESYNDYKLPEYDGEFTWTEVIKNADWSNRYEHAAVVFDNKMWVFGGYNPGQFKGDTYYEDVWSSEDGESWSLITDNAPWYGRGGHEVVVFDDGTGEALFLLGGFAVNEETGERHYMNDVWKSTDGSNWTKIKERTYEKDSAGLASDWFPRKDFGCVVANHGGTHYIYIIGGFTMLEEGSGRYAANYFNDVWRSKDGINWERLANNDFGIRAQHAIAVDPNTQRIYIQGGQDGTVFDPSSLGASHPLADWQALWYSDDGINWSKEIADDFDHANLWRADHEMVFYEDALWFLPGKTTSDVHYHMTYTSNFRIWKIDDLKNWIIDSEGAAFDARHSYKALLFKNKIWILGGFTNKYAQSNDVWSGEIK
jgi:hypothetical protein